MISNSTIRNCTKPFPAIQIMTENHVLGKVLIKNLYQKWGGETVSEIKEKHEDNPYNLRIGLPATDQAMRNDRLYFILNYLSYNPSTKDIEQREIVPYRNMSKVYIGQSLEEKSYSGYSLFVNDKVVVDDLYIKGVESLKDQTIGKVLVSMMQRIEKLQDEVVDLKRQLKTKHIYTQDTL